MEVKLRALENIAAAGMQTTLQVTWSTVSTMIAWERSCASLPQRRSNPRRNFSARYVHGRDERISMRTGMQNGILSLNSLTTASPNLD